MLKKQEKSMDSEARGMLPCGCFWGGRMRAKRKTHDEKAEWMRQRQAVKGNVDGVVRIPPQSAGTQQNGGKYYPLRVVADRLTKGSVGVACAGRSPGSVCATSDCRHSWTL